MNRGGGTYNSVKYYYYCYYYSQIHKNAENTVARPRGEDG